MGIYRFGTSNLPLTYTEPELEQKILDLIDEMPSQFSFQSLCNQLLQEADNEGKLRKDSDTEYSTIHLTTDDIKKVSKILWKMILERKIFTVFKAYSYSRDSQDTLFAKV